MAHTPASCKCNAIASKQVVAPRLSARALSAGRAAPPEGPAARDRGPALPCAARGRQHAQVQGEPGAPEHREGHVVVTARDLGRQIPSVWQQGLQSGRAITFPDYLANHNSGSRDGDVAFLTGAGYGGHGHFFDFETSPRIRYCVEIERVDLRVRGR